MVLVSTFLLNLLCAISPCDVVQNPPSSRISRKYYTKEAPGGGEAGLENEYPIVHTKSGTLQGYSMGTLQENQIFAFEGIRYGQAPINELRFRDPVPAKPWSGLLRAHKRGPMCLQIHPILIFRVVGNENCLFLNIYTPKLPAAADDLNDKSTSRSSQKLPVVIFIHGGNFIFGEAGEYGPAYIVDKNVILVTINYRLGPLGFMSTGDKASPGNYGLKDQALAIKWIHENIAEFGGDIDRVTLMGQSAGGVSVHLHLLSRQSRQYFQAAVSLSGTAFLPWALHSTTEARELTNQLAKITRCPTDDSVRLANCLRRRNPAFLVGYSLRLFKWVIFPPVLFRPVIEPKSPTAFITASPQELYDRDEVAKYPWICTLTTEEGYLLTYFLLALQQMQAFRRRSLELMSTLMDYDHVAPKNSSEIDTKVQKYYFGDESPLTVPLEAISKIATDRYFMHGIVKAARTHSQISPTYSYLFSYMGRFNFGKTAFGFREDELGIVHGEDMFYFFNSSRFYEGFKQNYEEYAISQVLTNLVSNFASKREPLLTNKLGEDMKIWNSLNPNDEVQFLSVGNNELKMIGSPFTERIKFWESLNFSDTTPYRPIPKFVL